MFCTFMSCTKQDEQIHLKFGQKSLKSLMIPYYENGEFSLDAFAVVTRRISMFRHEQPKCYNLILHDQIFFKFPMLDKGPGLKASTGSY